MQHETTIEELVKGGLIGATLGAVLMEDKEEGAIIGGLIGAALLSTKKANDEAKRLNVTLVVEEDGNLYEVNGKGYKRFIRKISKPSNRFPARFKLK
jgi:hypothetical protein